MRRRPALTLAVAASLTSGGVAPATAAAASLPLTEIHVGQAQDFTRIEFHGAQPAGVAQTGRDVVLRFGRIARPDLSQLRITPPRFLKGAESVQSGSGTVIRLTLADNVSAKLGRADGAAFINLSSSVAAPTSGGAAPTEQALAEQAQTGVAPSPAVKSAPDSEVVRMRPALVGRALRLTFAWSKPVGAAVFRRGEAVWIVFDSKARMDLAGTPTGLRQLRSAQSIEGQQVSAVRLLPGPGMNAGATEDGAGWTVTLSPDALAPATAVSVGREEGPGAGLKAALAGSTGVFWIDDPAVGDRVAVVTARAPTKGAASRQSFVEAAVLPSAQGLAVEPLADDLTVTASSDVVRIGRPRGLALSTAAAAARATGRATPDEAALPQPAAAPGLIPFDVWSRTGPAGFLARYDALSNRASEEAAAGPGAPTVARMGLARFLVGSELAFEAIGILNLTAKADPTLADTAEFRGLRGAARAIAGRSKDAEADFSAPSVANEPAVALWRGYALARIGDVVGARAAFAAGRSAAKLFVPSWRARFARADAEAALSGGDLETARAVLADASAVGVDPLDLQGLILARARLAEASGQRGEALNLYGQVETSSYGAIAAPASLHAVKLRLDAHALPAPEALSRLDSLRYRWRGDATELEVVRTLGGIFLAQGRYREALEALRSAGKRLPDLPVAAEVQADLANAFKALFLDGGADGLQPIQALALFDDFRELTPIGADGDLMVRRLAKRLVDVDLLDQAAALLKYQAENRLDGVPKAEVSTDLASIYLMARQPEAALDAINGSRSTLLPAALNAERRTVEARALVALGRFDHALELLGDDRSPEALEVRGDAAWGGKNWAQAGAALEAELGDRWKAAGQPLTPADEQTLLRTGVAYSLAQDEKALARLRARWGKLAAAGHSPDAMRVALTGLRGSPLSGSDLPQVGAEVDAFAGWVAKAKARFLAKG